MAIASPADGSTPALSAQLDSLRLQTTAHPGTFDTAGKAEAHLPLEIQHTTHKAASKVLGITELLEAILLHLPCARDNLQLLRVSKTFKDTIETSTALCRHFWWTPTAPANPTNDRTTRLNPLLPPALRVQSSTSYETDPPTTLIYVQMPTRLRKSPMLNSATLRRMLICNLPFASTATVNMFHHRPCPCANSQFSVQEKLSLSGGVFSNIAASEQDASPATSPEVGMTLSLVLETFSQTWKRGCTCGHGRAVLQHGPGRGESYIHMD